MKAQGGQHHSVASLAFVLAAVGALGALTSSAAGAARPADASHASMTASLTPNRLHAQASLKIAIDYPVGDTGIPKPVRHSILRLPAGLTLDIPHLSACSPDRLRQLGPNGCPAQSRLGRGHALVESRTASQTIKESVALWAFLGAPHNLRPTFVILAQGYSPVYQQTIVAGTVLSAHRPFGEELVMSIPPLKTIAGATDASIARLALTIGPSGQAGKHPANSLIAPSRCPEAGLPFLATFTYADGTTDSAATTDRCPR